MASIRFEKIQKRFDDVVVIKDIDLTINDGEFFTFLGPSGCGKSTILHLIAGLESVTEGRIYFDDAAINDLSPKDRDVAMVFQSYALYPHMTVYENIAFPLKMKQVPRDIIHKEVEKIVPTLGLEGLMHRKPRELSGGQRQRVALGRAIIRKPKVFLMDEPLSNLDARLRVEMRAELKKLHQVLKITTIYVTHDQSEAMSLSERIAVIHQGEIQQCGTPFEVYGKPANIFVAGFIGSPPINLIPASVRAKDPLEVECNGITLFPFLKNPPEGTNLLVGIRPEDILISSEKSENTMGGTVSLIESVGSFNWVDFMWNEVKVKGTSRADEPLHVGSQAFMKFSLDKVLFFDALSGKRLS